jgi:hypothetical protein
MSIFMHAMTYSMKGEQKRAVRLRRGQCMRWRLRREGEGRGGRASERDG